MKSIHDLIMRKRKFVGREKELQAMERLLTAEKEDWHILHLYGSAGIGKTVLLQQFASIHKKDFPIIYMESPYKLQSADDFLASFQRRLISKKMLAADAIQANANAIHQLIHIAKQHPIFVLIIDGFDYYKDILQWLKNEILHQLPFNIRIYTAGRLPFDHWQADYGFEHLVKNLPINPFTKTESTQYAAAHEITDERLLYQIDFISQGIPLAAALICQRISEHGDLEHLSEADYRSLIQLFEKHFLTEEKLNGINRKLLTLASLTYTFDQELLEHMIGKSISESEFKQLAQSPFVDAHANGGWMVKNGMRWWMRTGFKDKFPDAYANVIKRADELLAQRYSNTNDKSKKLQLAIGRFFLQDTEFTRSLIYFGGQQKINVRAAKKEDLPMLENMYQKNLQISPPFLKDDTHQEQYLHEIWKVNPAYIQLIEHHNKCHFFYVFVPLNEQIHSIFKSNPVTEAWIRTVQPDENDWLYWMISTNQPTDWEIVNCFFQQSFLPALENRRITCLFLLEDQAKFLKLLGFKHLAFADYLAASGLKFTFYQLDARNESSETGIETKSVFAKEKDEQGKWVNLTKKILSHFPRIERQLPLLEECRQLIASEREYDELAEQIRKTIKQQYEWLAKGSNQEKTQAKILKYAYFNTRESHESVADFLNIPASTYYRQLKKLVYAIASALQSQMKKGD